MINRRLAKARSSCRHSTRGQFTNPKLRRKFRNASRPCRPGRSPLLQFRQKRCFRVRLRTSVTMQPQSLQASPSMLPALQCPRALASCLGIGPLYDLISSTCRSSPRTALVASTLLFATTLPRVASPSWLPEVVGRFPQLRGWRLALLVYSRPLATELTSSFSTVDLGLACAIAVLTLVEHRSDIHGVSIPLRLLL